MNLLGCLGSSVVIARLGVCDEGALLIVLLRALASRMRHDLGILRITRLV